MIDQSSWADPGASIFSVQAQALCKAGLQHKKQLSFLVLQKFSLVWFSVCDIDVFWFVHGLSICKSKLNVVTVSPPPLPSSLCFSLSVSPVSLTLHQSLFVLSLLCLSFCLAHSLCLRQKEWSDSVLMNNVVLLSLYSGSFYNEIVLNHQTFSRTSLSIKGKGCWRGLYASSFNNCTLFY